MVDGMNSEAATLRAIETVAGTLGQDGRTMYELNAVFHYTIDVLARADLLVEPDGDD